MLMSSSPDLSEGDEDHRPCVALVKRWNRKVSALWRHFVSACGKVAYGALQRDIYGSPSVFCPLRTVPYHVRGLKSSPERLKAPHFYCCWLRFYGRTMMREPLGSTSKSTSTSSFFIRMHPSLAAWPIVSGSQVP